MNSNINCLIGKLENKLNQISELFLILDSAICSNKQDTIIVNNTRLLLHTTYDYIEKSLLIIKSTSNNLKSEIDNFTLPLSISAELSETVILFYKAYVTRNSILKSLQGKFRKLSNDLKIIYNSDVQLLIDTL